ncbi:hypothetical protein Tsubulata_047011 [Turnera subulata]|uniref:Peptidase A1 domain-containing protein n=1 Tax=Turnera subulata TaxID=218843 RepID=A0A9Q0JEA6_9ROSI|nr:hypothetical protein Tsubulata_047011 [Turnera subulata]
MNCQKTKLIRDKFSMATLISSTSLSSLFLSALLLLLLCLSSKPHVVEAKKTEETFPQTHTLEVASLLASDVCNRSPKVSNQDSSLQVVHNYGPCNPRNQGKGAHVPSHGKMLLQDKLRAKAIQAKAKGSKSSSPTAPVQSGTGLGIGTGMYAVTMGLGTPAQEQTLLLDATNDLSWIQCEPCSTSCHQKLPRFNPAKSSSYKNVSCSSATCKSINGLGQTSCSGTTCHYEYQLSSKSLSGVLATDTLSFTKPDTIPNFIFGCGQKNEGPFARASGVLSLSRSSLSLTSQIAGKYENRFSHCLPSSSSSVGHLTFGGKIPKTAKFTPIKNDTRSSVYPVDMTGVSVGGRLVPIDESFFEDAGCIVDPGTLISHLPPAVYSTMARAFEDLMTDYPRTDGYEDFQTCYDFTGYDSVKIPSISFHFNGGLELAVDKSGIMIALPSLKKVCLAFASNFEDGNEAIFGGSQLRTYDVIYDLAKGRIGFAPGGCS